MHPNTIDLKRRSRCPLLAVLVILIAAASLVTWQAASTGATDTIRPGAHAASSTEGRPTAQHSAARTAAAGSSADTTRRRTQPKAGASGAIPEGSVVTPFDVDHPALAGLDPDLLEAVQQAARAAGASGVRVRVTSGWRSAAHQRQLFNEAVRRYGSTSVARQYVLPPERSAHVLGRAVDIGPTAAADWFSRHGSRFGLCQMYANELWHYELVAHRDGRCPPMQASAAA